MNTSIKIDSRKFNDAVKMIIKNVPLSAKDVMKNEARLLVTSVVNKVKPDKGKLNQRIQKNVNWLYNKKAKPVKDGKRFLYRGQWITVNKKTIKPLIKYQVSHIGFFASNFMGSGNPLNAKAPSYVTRHGGVQGKTTIKSTPLGWSVTVLNSTDNMAHFPRTIGKYVDILNAFLKGRVKQMNGKIRGIISGRNSYKIPNTTK